MSGATSSGTVTQRLQAELESAVGSLYEAFGAATTDERSLMLTLHHDDHEEFVVRGLRRLSAGYHVLDSSRPWLCYWILHSLALLGRPVDEELYDRTVNFLEHCQDPKGGYAGGPGQMPHLATTYAATCTLVTLGGEEALSSINRWLSIHMAVNVSICFVIYWVWVKIREGTDTKPNDIPYRNGSRLVATIHRRWDLPRPDVQENKLFRLLGSFVEATYALHEGPSFCYDAFETHYSICRKKILQFLLRMRDPCGGFRVHDDGEMDMRGSFCALAVAHLLDIMVPELLENVGEFVRSCQTYEGGIGGEPGAEAHGGYTFCGLAALALTNQLHVLDLPSLVNWVAFRQGRVEGGFQGRTNKLVDGCYSFWQGGCFQLLQQHLPQLLAQQSMSAAALHISQDEIKSAKSGFQDTNDPEHAAAESDSEKGNLKSKAESSNNVLGDEAKSVEDCRSSADDSNDDARNQGSDATSSSPTSHTVNLKMNKVTITKVEASEEFHSPAKDIPAKEWHSDDDEGEHWDSDSKSGHNAADKLFPMSDAGVRTVPPHAKIVEVVELEDELHGATAGASGSNSNSAGSTFHVGSWGDTLNGPIFNSQALQAYILLCCQDLDGGLRDKPGKPCDFYHTCYCLSGLSAAQYSTSHRVGAPPPLSGVLGPYSNLLEATHALCNVRLDRYYEAQSYFKQRKESLDV